jgi:pimeloyl-ACP methyl ester carboxylesterase
MEHFNIQYATEGLPLPKNYSVQMESEAIRNTLDSLQIKEPIVLVGHSYGGVIAIDFALNHPDQVRSLVLIEPPVFGIAEAKNESPEGMREMMELVKELTPGAEITERHVERFRCALLNCDSVSIRQHPQWAAWVKQKNRLRGLSAIREYKLDLNKIQKFRQRVLVVTGTETVFFHKRINKLLAIEFPFAREISIQSGHAIPTSAPAELTRCLLDFFKATNLE